MTTRNSSSPRALISPAGYLLVGAVALSCFTLLLPFALERERQAALEEPSTLSMTYLRLSLKERPHDAELRLQVAEAALRMFAFDEARGTLAPLLSRGDELGRRAREVLVDLEQKAWAAVSLDDDVGRAQAIERYRAALRGVRPHELSAKQIDELARRTREVGLLGLRAQLLSERAQRSHPPTAAQVASAEQALVEAGAPLAAARLCAREALRTGELGMAMRALRHARSADQPDAAWALFEQLRPRFSERVPLLEAGIALASDREDATASMLIAEQLLALEPTRPERHAQLAQLATWSGHMKRALVEQLWLLEHGAGPEAYRRAEQTSRALSDLRALRTVYARGTQPDKLSRAALLKRISVFVALGEPTEAEALLVRALDGAHGDDPTLWNLRFALERADGRLADAVVTLGAMDERFPRRSQRTELRADLLMRLGRLGEAVGLLAAETPRDDYGKITRLAQLAWSMSDVGVARAAYRDASALRAAKESDYQRLYALDVLEGDLEGALATAQRGLARFESLAMLELTMSAALTAGDEAVLSRLFLRTEGDGHPLQQDLEYVVLRVSYRQALAAKARTRSDYQSARLILGAAGADLSRAIASAGAVVPERLRLLASSQHAEELSLALAEHDRVRLATLYDRVAGELSPRQRVYVLHELGRDEDAVSLATRSLARGEVSAQERAGLEHDLRSLAADLPRRVDGQLEATDMGPLRLWQARASVTYAKSRRIWSGGIEYTKLDVTDQSFVQLDKTHELSPWAGLRKVWPSREASLRLGVDLRDGVSPRPYGALGGILHFARAATDLSLSTQLNEVANDTAALRLLGVRDVLGASVETSFTERFFGSASTHGVLYGTRDRELLGGGMTAEAALGARLFAPESALFGNVRVATRLAPRWSVSESPESLAAQRAHAEGWLVPDSTHWLGLGASLGRGSLSQVALTGRAFGFLLDGAAGWLFPQNDFGYFVRAGVGTSVVGQDLLSLTGRASNVIGTQPGSAVWSLQLDYALGLWR